MTTFTDGPAAGVNLTLKRAPLFLRVVRDASGKWDALDALTDLAAPDETIHVYRKVSDDSSGFLDYTDKQGRRRGMSFHGATYQLHSEQPDDRTARSILDWPKWAQAQADALKAKESA